MVVRADPPAGARGRVSFLAVGAALADAPSPRHHAEFLGGVLKQHLNLVKTISIYVAKVLPGHTGLVQPDILASRGR